MKRYHEEGRIDGRWVERFCHGRWARCVRYQMVECGEPHPDWMLPDGSLEESLAGPRARGRSGDDAER
jgi:hypothetical protein